MALSLLLNAALKIKADDTIKLCVGARKHEHVFPMLREQKES